jgi:hypothetical protein
MQCVDVDVVPNVLFCAPTATTSVSYGMETWFGVAEGIAPDAEGVMGAYVI